MKISIRIIVLSLFISTQAHAAVENGSTLINLEPSLMQQTIDSYGKLPLSFEANAGQTAAEVQFFSRGPGYILYLTDTEAVLSLVKGSEKRRRGEKGEGENKTVMASTLRMKLVGANRRPAITGEERLPGKSHYFVGSDASKWRSDVPNYARVKYEQIYPGIDLAYYGNQQQLEYDFIVAPGANPDKIRLGFTGSEKVEISREGDLLLKIGEESVRLLKPLVYQEKGGSREIVPAWYVSKGKDQIGFQVGSYDKKRVLIIDPVLTYSALMTGTDAIGYGIAVDRLGAAYVVGRTFAFNFPTTAGALDSSYNGGADFFILKLNSTGSERLYATYLGGSGGDLGTNIAIDASGNAYVTGVTDSSDFPTTPGAFNTTPVSGIPNVVAAKLDSTGSKLLYSTFLGGSGTDFGPAIAVDGSGQAYIAGQAAASFPTTPGAFDRTFNGGSHHAFITKLNSTGSALIYSTFLGGTDTDFATAVAVDGLGQAYVTGRTFSFDFPTSAGTFDPVHHGLSDTFVTKVNATGSALLYSTFLGGNGSDAGRGIAVNSSGEAYVTGETQSSDFPTTPGAFGRKFNGSFNVYVTKLNSTGSALLYSTFLGGGFSYAIAIDRLGQAYVTGNTQSFDFPTTFGAYDTGYNGADDVFITKLNAAGSSLLYSTFLGGMATDDGNAIAVDASGQIYITGLSTSVDFPTTPGTFSTGLKSSVNLFVTKLNPTHLSFSDSFNRANSTQLGPSWNESLPDLEIFDGHIRNVNVGEKAAIYTRAVGPDQTASVECKITHNDSSCGVMARWSDGNHFYHAKIDVGRQNIALFKTVNGITTALGATDRALQLGAYYRIRLAVEGPSLSVYFANEPGPAIHVNDDSLSSGDFGGIRSSASAARSTGFNNFNVTTPLADTFTRVNSNNIGTNWSEYIPNLEIFSNQLRNSDTGNNAALFNQTIGPDQNVTVHCKVTAEDNSCGIMARWSSEQNFYRLRLDAGRQNIVLLKTVDGTTTTLGSAPRPLQMDTYYRLRLVVRGNSLAAFFGNESTPALTLSDTSLANGDFAGVRSFASAPSTTWFDHFTARIADE